MEISKETKQEAILYSLRGRIISFIGIIFTIIFGIIIFFKIAEMLYKVPYTVETRKAIAFIGGLCVSLFSTHFFTSIFVSKNVPTIINFCWFIKEPTEKELNDYFSRREKEIQNSLKELGKEIKNLKKEKASFLLKE